jgi:large subunit ribosomal protein L6
MSRIGKQPVEIPSGVKAELKGQCLKVTGPLGSMQMDCHPQITIKLDQAQNKIILENQNSQNRQSKQMHGTMRALIANMMFGVSKGFEQKMEIYGTGYSVKEQGGKLIFSVGYSHPVEITVPKVVKIKIDVAATRGNDVPAKFTLNSTDKAVLGQLASDIRKVMPPEPYQGKGIRFADEQVRRKVGKAFASGAA